MRSTTHILAVNVACCRDVDRSDSDGRKEIREKRLVYFKSVVLSGKNIWTGNKNIRCQEFLIFILKPSRKISKSYYRKRDLRFYYNNNKSFHTFHLFDWNYKIKVLIIHKRNWIVQQLMVYQFETISRFFFFLFVTRF